MTRHRPSSNLALTFAGTQETQNESSTAPLFPHQQGSKPQQEMTGPLHEHHVRMVDASFYVAGNGNESPLGIHNLQQRDGRQLIRSAAAVRVRSAWAPRR